MTPSPLRALLARLLWLCCGIAVGAVAAAGWPAGAEPSRPETVYRKLEVLAEVFGHIESHYVDVVPAKDLVYAAAKGVVSSLDEHSAFFSPSEYETLVTATEGEYAGIGIELRWDAELPKVVSVFAESPAARAGLQPGDRLVRVGGKDVRDFNVEMLHHALRGPVGSKIVLHVRRDEAPPTAKITVVRGWVRVQAVDHQSLQDGLEYLRIKTFSRRTAQRVAELLRQHPPRHGLVLDLRANPGGLFEEAVRVADLFLEEGRIATVVGRDGRVLEKQRAHRRDTQSAYPIAVLVDEGSASAAEVLAGALRDRDRARLFGGRTYGKGSVQSIIGLSDGSGLKFTVARYLTPAGRSLDGAGLKPDVVVTTQDDAPIKAAVDWFARQ